MDRRLQLHEVLAAVLGSRNVYFQPPSNVAMQYPAIVYNRERAQTEFADNQPYRRMTRYQVTLIDEDPDSPIRDKIADLPTATHERWFPADNLNHDVFNLFF